MAKDRNSIHMTSAELAVSLQLLRSHFFRAGCSAHLPSESESGPLVRAPPTTACQLPSMPHAHQPSSTLGACGTDSNRVHARQNSRKSLFVIKAMSNPLGSRGPGASVTANHRLSTVPTAASKQRQLSHLQAQLAQLTAHMSDLENLLRMTAVQAEGMRGLGGYALAADDCPTQLALYTCLCSLSMPRSPIRVQE